MSASKKAALSSAGGAMLLGLIILISSCGKPADQQAGPVHYCRAVDIQDFFTAEGIKVELGRFSDNQFATPSAAWMTNDFSKAFRKLLKTMQSEKWIVEKNDCDDFAAGAKWFSQILHNRSTSQPCALAVGTVIYKQSLKTPHKINAVIVWSDKDQNFIVHYYEPQTGRFLELTPSEKETISAYEF